MRTYLPPPGDFDAEALARATAPAIGLPFRPEDVTEIALNLSRTAGFAALVARVPGLDAVEGAPVFRADERGSG